MRPYITIICITFLLVFTAEAATQNATLDDAKLAIRTQDFAKAASILKPLAKKGDKQAQYQLAVLYRNGQGAKKDPDKAFLWMKRSANQGYKRAQYSLGTLYEAGVGVKVNADKKVSICTILLIKDTSYLFYKCFLIVLILMSPGK